VGCGVFGSKDKFKKGENMKIRLAVLAAALGLFAAAPVWAGTMTVDFTGHHAPSYKKHIGHAWRYGDRRNSDPVFDLGTGNKTDPWLASSAPKGDSTDAWVKPNKPRGGDDKSWTDSSGSTAAPEPSSVSLFAIALIGLGLVARRHYSTSRA
jgi:hypothetical protein